MDSRFAQLGDLRAHYMDGGSGDPLVLLHGATESGEGGIAPTDGWTAYLSALTDRFRVVVPDARGHGATVNPAGHLTYTLLAQDVIRLCGVLGLERIVLWGISMGGLTALTVAMQAPELIRALVVQAAAPFFSAVYYADMMAWLHITAPEQPADLDAFAESDPGAVTRNRRRHGAQGPDHWRTLFHELQSLVMTQPAYSDDDYKRVNMPTLVVGGDRDSAFGVEDIVALARRLPNAELAILPGLGHERQEDPRRAVAMLEDFLARHPESATLRLVQR